MNHDYIMRMIEQFFNGLATIINKRKAGDHQEAFRLIQNSSEKFLKKDISLLLRLTPKELLEQFRNGPLLDAEQCMICGDLFYELVLLLDSQKQIDLANRFKMMALNLYINAIPQDLQLQTEHYLDKTKLLSNELSSEKVPEDVKENLQFYKKFLENRSKLKQGL